MHTWATLFLSKCAFFAHGVDNMATKGWQVVPLPSAAHLFEPFAPKPQDVEHIHLGKQVQRPAVEQLA
jgi:hypothetical protein